jgi:hypothetical protein
MDRISALRNIEEALRSFEAGDADLASTERRVVTVLRTYATEFDDGELAAYRATGDDRAQGLVVIASSEDEASRRISALLDGDDVEFGLDRLS